MADHPRHAAPNTRARDWTLPKAPGTLAVARALVREALAAWAWPDERVDDVVQVVSELVGNVLRHTSAEAQLTLTPTADGVLIGVGDRAGHLLVLQRPPNAHGGYGLLLLDRLTDGWTIEEKSSGKHVYAHIRR
ncbi:ATP-binding protein [Embleya sp. NPDC055664]|uniref:ATP-binding protein n=1 Tax=Embleya sp. NPDC059237 TaxID=3346784 RepID=UPI00368F907F